MSSPTIKYKLGAFWSLKKETFLNAIERDEDILSEDFKTSLSVFDYYFTMSPGKGGYSSITFDTVAQKATVKEMELSIPSANFECNLVTSAIPPDEGEEYEYMVFIKREDLLDPEKKFFVNDVLKMEFYGVLCYEKEQESFDLGELLWKNDNNKDFTIVVGNEAVKVHKLVLGQFSSVLTESFNLNEVKIDNFDKKIVEAAIGLCYGKWLLSDCLPATDKTFFKLVEFTNVYGMPLIKEQVEQKMIDFIKKENACKWANKTVEYKCDKLRGYCINFIANCIKENIPFDGFESLKKEIAAEVYKNYVCHSQVS